MKSCLTSSNCPLDLRRALRCPSWVIMPILCFGLFSLSWPSQDKKGLSTALLIVYLESAFNLPVSTNHMQAAFAPNPWGFFKQII